MKKGVKKFFRKNWIILLIIVVILAWLVYSYFAHGIIYDISNSDVDSVVKFIQGFGFWAWLIFILLVILEVVLAPIPPLVLYVAAGFLFGAFLGGILALIGNLIGAGIDYFLAKKYGRNIIIRKTDKKIREKFDKFSEKYGGFAIFLLRINPITTTDLISYLAGLTRIRFWKFIVWTGVGLTPMIFLQTYLGEVFIRDYPVFSAILVVLSILYLLFFVYLVVKVLVKKK